MMVVWNFLPTHRTYRVHKLSFFQISNRVKKPARVECLLRLIGDTASFEHFQHKMLFGYCKVAHLQAFASGFLVLGKSSFLGRTSRYILYAFLSLVNPSCFIDFHSLLSN